MIIERKPGPPTIFDTVIPCCNRPLGVCNLDPCSKRKEQWKQISTQPPGI